MADIATLVVSLEAQTANFSAGFDKANLKLDAFHSSVNSHVKGIASAFESLRGGVETLTRSFDVLAAFTIGGRLAEDVRKLTDSVEQASAAASGPFKAALDSVKENFQDLLVPDAALPGATDALNELSAAIADPNFQRAAQTFTGALLDGLADVETAAAKSVGALQRIIDTMRSVPKTDKDSTPDQQSDALAVQIAHLQDAAASAMSIANSSVFSGRTDALKQYSDLEGQIQALQAKLNDSVQRAAADKFSATLLPVNVPNIPGQGEQLGPSGTQQFDEITKQASSAISTNAKQIEDTVASNKQQLAQMLSDTQTSIEKQVSEWENFNAKLNVLLNSGAISPAEAAARQSAELDEILSPVSVGADKIAKDVKDSSDKMSEYGKEAARNIQDAFANFLFDPFSDGLKGMLDSFAKTLEKMVAQAAASKILQSVGSEALSAGGVIGGIAKFFGATAHAGGGAVTAGMPYLVGENGPELMVPGVSGSIVPSGGLGGGGVTIHQSIDARYSTPDAVAMLPAAMQQARRQAVADVLALNRQGKLGRRS